MKMGLIYKVTCIKNGNFLIGSTTNFKKRKRDYFSSLKRGTWNNSYLQNCYNLYGKDSIIFEVLQNNIPDSILEYVEDIYIEMKCARVENRKGGMNMRGASRFDHSEDMRNKMRLATIKQIKEKGHPMLGKHHGNETKEKLREATLLQLKTKGHPFKGRKHSQATKEKIRNTLLNKPRPKPAAKKK